MHSTEELFEFALESIKNTTQSELNYIQKILLWEVLNHPQKTYRDIAEEQNYSERYISHTIAPQLWEVLTSVWGDKICKKNCYVQLSKRLEENKQLYSAQLSPNQQQIACHLPSSPIPLESPFYIERPPLESNCYQEILKPGGLLLITAGKKMGKTSLAQRIINRAQQYNFPTVYISLNLVESQLFSSTAKFLRWLCANLTRQLKLESQLDNYWDEDIGSLVSCTVYVQDYLLPAIDAPILLVLDDVNQLFEFPSLSRDFLALLRSWHERTQYHAIWQNLRLVIVKSTHCYINLDVNESPFTVGLSLNLPRFTATQVEKLARQYEVQLSSTELVELMSLLGGFPYLVNLALYHRVMDDIPLTELLSTATSETGIFSQHLHEQLNYLQNYPELKAGFQQVLRAQAPVELEQVLAFKLNSLGLIDLKETTARVSCQLYQEYFSYSLQLIIG